MAADGEEDFDDELLEAVDYGEDFDYVLEDDELGVSLAAFLCCSCFQRGDHSGTEL